PPPRRPPAAPPRPAPRARRRGGRPARRAPPWPCPPRPRRRRPSPGRPRRPRGPRPSRVPGRRGRLRESVPYGTEPTSAARRDRSRRGRTGYLRGPAARGYTRRVTDAGRFERGERYAAAHGVVTTRGVDTITGLDVLIYDFPGTPTLAAGASVSDHALKVLYANAVEGDDGPRGCLVAAYPTGASLVARGESAVDDRFVLQAVQGLRDAHAQGVYHGDITPSRLLYFLGEVYIEGFGVPWRKGGDKRALMRADVVALAK